MTDPDALKKMFEQAAGHAASEADATLANDLKRLLERGPGDLQRLAPSVSDQDQSVYQELIAIVDESTRHNVAIGDIVDRVKNLGGAASNLVKDLVGKLPLA